MQKKAESFNKLNVFCIKSRHLYLYLNHAMYTSSLLTNIQLTLKIGFALPVWGEGKNSPTKEAKQFVEDLFNQGQKQKPVPAADAVVLMQEKLDSTGAPMFDASTFLDEDQIKSMFGTISHSRKRSLTGAWKPGSVTKTVGVDLMMRTTVKINRPLRMPLLMQQQRMSLRRLAKMQIEFKMT